MIGECWDDTRKSRKVSNSFDCRAIPVCLLVHDTRICCIKTDVQIRVYSKRENQLVFLWSAVCRAEHICILTGGIMTESWNVNYWISEQFSRVRKSSRVRVHKYASSLQYILHKIIKNERNNKLEVKITIMIFDDDNMKIHHYIYIYIFWKRDSSSSDLEKKLKNYLW